MSKTIVIPTDFSIESLFLAKQALNNQDEKVNIVLLHCRLLQDSITDLLFYSAEKILQPLVSSDFKEACSIIENKYESVLEDMRTELFHGQSGDSFQRFIAAQQMDEAYIPATYKFRLKGYAIDPLPLICNSSLLIHEVDWEQHKNLPEKDQLAELFFE